MCVVTKTLLIEGRINPNIAAGRIEYVTGHFHSVGDILPIVALRCTLQV
jgi:hypothetical protein